MNRLFWQVLLLCLIAGCQHSSDVPPTVQEVSVPDISGKPLTNRFGMTFCFVEVDRNAVIRNTTIPRHSYYLQQTTLTYEQFAEYKKASGTDVRFPTEWREYDYLARALSELDSDYDYRLPSQAEWTYACMNGDEQDCPHSTEEPYFHHSEERPSSVAPRPNRYGVRGFLDGDAECVAPAGTFMGMGDQPTYVVTPPYPCLCERFAVGNPDGDDGLNELIVARFVLIPK